MGIKKDPIDGGTLVPYVWPYFVGIFPYIGLIYTYGRYLQFRFLRWPVNSFNNVNREAINPDHDSWGDPMPHSRAPEPRLLPVGRSLEAIGRAQKVPHVFWFLVAVMQFSGGL